MGDASASEGYWCHACSRIVSPVVGVEMKCPLCDSGFLEEMASWRGDRLRDSESEPDRALSLWAPILLGMMGSSQRRRGFRRRIEEENNEEGEDERRRASDGEQTVGDGDFGELEATQRRRRRNGAVILRLLRSIREDIVALESDTAEASEQDRFILINPFNQAIIIQGSFGSTESTNRNSSGFNRLGTSLGDYFAGPGLDLLLQHLAENDPSRQGTPPTQKDAVVAMPMIKITEKLQCPICLEDFLIDSEAKEMPCEHKFHSECILPWLEIHSSCPVCRHQMPVDDGNKVSQDSGNTRHDGNMVPENDNRAESSDVGVGRGGGEEPQSSRRFWFPWPFNGLFSHRENGNSSPHTGDN